MSKETKILFENWRKFLSEGRDDYGWDKDPDQPPEGPPLEPGPDDLDLIDPDPDLIDPDPDLIDPDQDSIEDLLEDTVDDIYG